VAARSKAWVCGRSLAEIVGFESRRGHGCLFVVSVVFFQVEASATSRSLVQRSPTDCDVSLCVCDLETSRMRKPWLVLGRSATERKKEKKI